MPLWVLSLLGSKYFWAALAVAAIVGKLFFWHHSIVVKAVDAEKKKWETRIDAANEARRDEVAGWVVEMHKRVDAARIKAKAEQDALVAETDDRIRRVKDYVTAQADANCVITRGFVQSRNAAAAGTAFSATTGGSVDAPSGVALSDVAANDIEAASRFRQCVSRLAAFKRAWADEAEKWNRFAEQMNKPISP
jgi:hypothetical protein